MATLTSQSPIASVCSWYAGKCKLLAFSLCKHSSLWANLFFFPYRNLEFLDRCRDVLEVQLTDLDTALFLTKLLPTANILPIFKYMRSISLCLFTTLEAYQAMSAPEPLVAGPRHSDHGSEERPTAKLSNTAQIWRQVWPGLAALPQLTNLSLWLDHEDITWSAVDERPLLRPLAIAQWRDQVKITIHLPILPKDKIRREHYNDSAVRKEPPRFTLVRRIRRPEVAPFGYRIICWWPDVEEDAKVEDEWGHAEDMDSYHVHPCSEVFHYRPPIVPKGWWVAA